MHRWGSQRGASAIAVQVGVGIACVVIGLVLVLVIAGDDDGGTDADAGVRSVLRATDVVAAGTDIDLAVADGLLVAVDLPAADVPTDAAPAGVSYGGQSTAGDVASGAILATSDIARSNLRASAVEVPAGLRAVAVRLPFVEGLAGYAAPGDRVDVFAVLAPDPANGVATRQTRLVATDVAVLDVSQQIAPLVAAGAAGEVRETGQALTYLLAVNPAQAEALVFTSNAYTLHLVLTGQDAPPIVTDGYGVTDLLGGPARTTRATADVLRIVAGLLVGGGFAVLVLGALRAGWRRELSLEELLDLPTGDGPGTVVEAVQTAGLGERAVLAASQLVESMDQQGTLRKELEQARIPLRTGEVAGLVTSGGLVAGGVAWLVTGQPLIALGALASAPVVARSVIRRRARKRLQRFDEDLPEAIALIASSMSAGHTFLRSIQITSAEASGPVSEELRRVVQETQLGAPLVEALDRMATRVPLESVSLVLDAVRVQQKVGGSLTDVLHSLAEFIRARHELRREVLVLTAEGRMSGNVLGVVPLVLLLAMGALSPGYTDPLFRGWGLVWLGACVALVVIGVAWIRKMSDLEL